MSMSISMSHLTHEPLSAVSASASFLDLPEEATTTVSIPASPSPSSIIIPSSPISEPESEPESEPDPVLKPLIAEVLRTRYCAPGCVVLVEGVDIAPTSPLSISSERRRGGRRGGEAQSQQSQSQSQRRKWRAIRLLLGDGELCIQALLAPEMHPYVDAGEVAIGSYVRLEKFRIEWLEEEDEEEEEEEDGGGADVKGKGKERESDPMQPQSERVVCLVVEDLVAIGWSRTLVEMAKAGAYLSAESEEEYSAMDVDEDEEALPLPSRSPSSSPSQSPSRAREQRRAIAATTAAATAAAGSKPQQRRPEEPLPPPPPSQIEHLEELADAIADTAPDSELKTTTLFTRQEQAEQNQVATALHHQTVIPSSPPTPRPLPVPRPPIITTTTATTTITTRPHAHPLPRARQPITDPTHPVKLTPLKSIPYQPYKQNWSMNVLAIVTYLSPLEPSGIPPYTNTQRRARLADPSTSKRVLLTVFLDAEEFVPELGSVVLLLGVKNHRFEGGCLKMYASDRPVSAGGDSKSARQRWWFENPEGLGWCDGDVRSLKAWWEGETLRELEQQQGERMQM